VIREHNEQVQKADKCYKENKEIERKLEQIGKIIEEDEEAKRVIQEQFS